VADPTPREISRMLAQRVDQLVADLLPAGHREGHEWCVARADSPLGCSISVHLAGSNAGLWGAWAIGNTGDALDLVRAVLGLGMGEALAWSRRWLGLEEGDVALPARPASVPTSTSAAPNPDHWRAPWQQRACPIAGTLAEVYLAGRDLRFDDPAGEVLRFTGARRHNGPRARPSAGHPRLELNDDVNSSARPTAVRFSWASRRPGSLPRNQYPKIARDPAWPGHPRLKASSNLPGTSPGMGCIGR
jgi:hypothetical protein